MAQEKRESVTFRISPALFDRLQREAERRVVSRNLLVEKALDTFLTELEGQDV